MAMNIDIDFEFRTLQMIVTATVTVAAVLLGMRWQLAKNKLNKIRKLLDDVDDAVRDDKITEDEFRKIWTDFAAMVSQDEIRAIIQRLKAGFT